MVRTFLPFIAFLGAIGVILGALGAHALTDKISASQLSSFNTAVLYQMLHVLALLGVCLADSVWPGKLWKVTGWLFVGGIVLFSGSIFLLSTRPITGLDGIGFLGPITPLGGLLFISGWLLMVVQAFQLKK